MAAHRPRIQGYGAALLCAVLAGSAYTVFKRVDPAVPRFTSLTIMSLVASLFFGLLRGALGARLVPRLRPFEVRVLFWQTTLTFFGIWGIWAGVVRLDPAVASFLGRTEGLFSLAAAVVLLGERFRRAEIPGVLLAVLGVALLLQDGLRRSGAGLFGEGAAYVLGGAAVMGFSEVWSKKAMATVTPLDFAFLRAVLLTVAFAASGAATGALVLPSARDASYVALAALLAPAGARLLFLVSLRTLDLARSVTVNLAQPLFAGLLALVWLRTSPPAVQWAGGLLALAGCALLVWARPREPAQSKSPRPNSTG